MNSVTKPLKQVSVFSGVFYYEFRMQLRRRALWLTILLLGLLVVLLFGRNAGASYVLSNLGRFPILTLVAWWTAILNYLFPLGVGCLLADRLVRDYRTKAAEIFTTMPAALSARLIGKYLGTLLATLMPILLFYAIGVGYIVYQTHNWLAIPLAVETFAAISLPGLLFIAAFSLACPLFMWVPLYQFCFIGYWFWGNFLSPHTGIPTLSDTILTPAGGYMAKGFYSVDLHGFPATPLQGAESIVALVGIALLVLIVLWRALKWQQARG